VARTQRNEEKLRLEYADVAAIPEADRNPKGHDLPRLKGLIRKFGFVMPLILDERTGKLVAGHGRRLALLEMKEAGEPAPARVRVEGDLWMVPVVRGVAFQDAQQAEAYLLVDNRLVELGGYDPQVMAQFVEGWDAGALKELGWDQRALSAVLDQADFSATKRGSTPEQQLPGFNAGAVKQVVVYFAAAEYEAVQARCEKAMQGLKASTAAELFVALVAFYEKRAALKKGKR
jgi:hypothetical protein